MGHTKHEVLCENTAGELSWLLRAIKLEASHRQVFTTVHGATWLLSTAKSACTRMLKVAFMVLFMKGCLIHCGPPC